MGKRKKQRTGLFGSTLPEGSNLQIPIFATDKDGTPVMDVATGTLKAGTLVLEFNDKLAAIALQRLMSQGILLGFNAVMLDEAIVAAGEIAEEIADEELQEQLDEAFASYVEEINLPVPSSQTGYTDEELYGQYEVHAIANSFEKLMTLEQFLAELNKYNNKENN